MAEAKAEKKAGKNVKVAKEKAQKSPPADTGKKSADVNAKRAPSAASKRSSRKTKRSLLLGYIHISATYNNTIVTVTEPNGNVVCWGTAGASGFKGTRKATPYAAQIAMENTLTKAKAYGLQRAHVFVKGIGVGRDQALRAIPQQDIEIESITDRTAMPHGGVRPPRARRV